MAAQAGAAAQSRDPRNDDLSVIGWIAVFFMPFAAIVIGFVLRGRGDSRGNPILAVSIATQVIALVILVVILNGVGSSSDSTADPCVFDHRPTAAERQRCFDQGMLPGFGH
jgi:hypothetical protein